MPAALADLVAVAALLLLLAVAFCHPRGRVEAALGVLAAAAVLATGALTRPQVEQELRMLLPVVGFLAAILVVGAVCAAEGVFTSIGGLVARHAQRRPVRLLVLTFLVASLTTAALGLDATVVLLTPVMLAAAASTAVSPTPAVHASVRLANSASVLLPVSNLTNLLALPALHLRFLQFAGLMAPTWLAVVAVEYGAQRWFFRRRLADEHVGPGAPSAPAVPDGPLPRFPLVVLAAMLAGFAAASPLGVGPVWVAAAAALVLAGNAVRRGRTSAREVLHALHPGFAVYVLCLGVVVAALGSGVLGRVVENLAPDGTTLLDLLGVAAVATVLANTVNNLPATLLLVPAVAPAGATAVLAALVGLNAGSNLTYGGSLANLLWRRTLVRSGHPPSARTFHRLSAVATLPTVGAGVVVLWAWTRLVS